MTEDTTRHLENAVAQMLRNTLPHDAPGFILCYHGENGRVRILSTLDKPGTVKVLGWCLDAFKRNEIGNHYERTIGPS